MNLSIDDQIASLNRDVVKMASLCERALVLVKEGVDNEKAELKSVQVLSDEIEKAEREIESFCMRLLLRRHPVARDLRSVSATLRIINDLERIGNNAQDLAEVMNYVVNRNILNDIEIPAMIDEVLKMLKTSIDAYIRLDEKRANEVIKEDDVLDSLFVKAKEGLVDMIKTSVDGIEEAPDALLAAKYLERMGDHCVNLSKQLIWSISGDINF